MIRSLVIVFIGLFALAACDSDEVPGAAHRTLRTALTSLADGKFDEFKAKVVPAQRTGALGLASTEGFPSGTDVKDMTLDQLLDRPFFKQIKSATIRLIKDSNVTDDSVRIVGILDFGEDNIAPRRWVMVVKDDDWFIDMKETMALWQITNGPDTFKILKRTK